MIGDGQSITTEDLWLGSYYELAIELSSCRDDEYLRRGLHALWNTRLLAGPWQERTSIGKEPTPVERLHLDLNPSAYALLHVSGHEQLPCAVIIVREDEGSDWLDVCVPTGALEQVFEVQYPLDRKRNPWLNDMDEALLAVADRMYEAVPFDLALIGEEASGYARAKELLTYDLKKRRDYVARGGYLFSARLKDQLQLDTLFELRPSGLFWRA